MAQCTHRKRLPDGRIVSAWTPCDDYKIPGVYQTRCTVCGRVRNC